MAAFTLLRMTAQAEVAHHAVGGEGLPPPDLEMYSFLTAALEMWQGLGTLRPHTLLLIEWLATERAAYRTHILGQDSNRSWSWLGDEVSLSQRHPHPASPTCIELHTVVASAPPGERSEERAVRLAVPFLSYLRPASELEDAREIALSFALWAGHDLAALMRYDAERIAGYTQVRFR